MSIKRTYERHEERNILLVILREERQTLKVKRLFFKKVCSTVEEVEKERATQSSRGRAEVLHF